MPPALDSRKALQDKSDYDAVIGKEYNLSATTEKGSSAYQHRSPPEAKHSTQGHRDAETRRCGDSLDGVERIYLWPLPINLQH
jgi:hypothetical protein